MEDPTSPTTNLPTEPASPWTQGLGRSLDEQRRQIEEFLASRRRRMDGVEPELTDGLVQLVDELIRSRSEANAARDELLSREAGLQRQSEHVERMQAEVDAMRAEWEQSRRETEKQQSAFLQQMHNQRQELQELFNRQLEENARRPSAPLEAGSDEEEYQERYQLSLQDIRELKVENEELKKELARASARPQAAAAVPLQAADSISWEAQKQKLLAALESEYDENNPEDLKQRSQIEEIVQETELAIAQKDGEIKELKKLLVTQSENIGTVTVGAAAFGEMLDNDQIIQEERESLRQLQEEMRRKLVAAEIDISVERAKIARQRVELEEKMRQQALNQSDETSKAKNQPDGQDQPVRGRWLSRLGLNDLDQ